MLRSLLVLLALSACTETPDTLDSGPTPDAGARDAGTADAGTADAGAELDATTPDASADDDAGPLPVDAGCMPTPARFFLIGDSTVSSRSGWGDSLSMFLRDDVEVLNPASSGSSSRSFYEGGLFDETRGMLREGDYLFIQFGHNDSKTGERRTEPGEAPDYVGTYRDYLEMYIAETRAAGAVPVLITSMSRMTFGSDGAHRRTHGDYAPAVRQIALDNDVELLDLEAYSHDVFDELGEEETVRLYAGFNDDPKDRTHFPQEKAPRVAMMVVDLLRSSSLACFVAAE
ncbi:MAG: rhamnogalacturonan acetylesterase [Polyangiales bacterium]